MNKTIWKKDIPKSLNPFARISSSMLLTGVILLLSIDATLAVEPPSAAASIITTVDAVGMVGEHSSLELNESEFAVISYYDGTNHNLKLAVCNDTACTAPELIVVDSYGYVGKSSSLELNSSGFAFLSAIEMTG